MLLCGFLHRAGCFSLTCTRDWLEQLTSASVESGALTLLFETSAQHRDYSAAIESIAIPRILGQSDLSDTLDCVCITISSSHMTKKPFRMVNSRL